MPGTGNCTPKYSEHGLLRYDNINKRIDISVRATLPATEAKHTIPRWKILWKPIS